MAKSIAARPPFMSAEPRPYIRPSTISAPNGSTVQPSPSVTTSVWPSNISVGPGPPPPSTTAITLGRPGATTSICGSQPNDRIRSATSSAAGSSSRPRAGIVDARDPHQLLGELDQRGGVDASSSSPRRQVGGVKRPSAAVHPPSTKTVVPVT